MKTTYDAYAHSACYDCGYCKERRIPETDAHLLDVRRNAVVKIWCYAANDVVAIMTAMDRDKCPHYAAAEGEPDIDDEPRVYCTHCGNEIPPDCSECGCRG